MRLSFDKPNNVRFRLSSHSVEVLQKHYDRMSLVKRAAEVAPRNYGKVEEKAKVVGASDLDCYYSYVFST